MAICDFQLAQMHCGREANHPGPHLLVYQHSTLPDGFSNETPESVQAVAAELARARHVWELNDWDPEDCRRASTLFLERVDAGESPREAFRAVTLQVWVRDKPHVPRHSPPQLARRLGLRPGDHHLIERLACEWEESYTTFLRGIVEGWAAHYRRMILERPELDLNYDPAVEDE